MTAVTGRRARRAWLQVHLWLGLTLGVIGALLGVSGSLLVYDHELDHWLHPQRYALTGAQAGQPVSVYARSAAQSIGGDARATAIRFPDGEANPVVVFVRAGTGPFQRVYLDPPTGRVLDVGSGGDLFAWLHNFHESLTLRDWYGREIVGAVGVAMLVSSLTGIYLWWPVRRPGGGSTRAAFTFRRGLPISRNLHLTFGFWGALVLAVLSFTGAVIAFPDAGRAVVGVLSPVSPSPRGVQSEARSGPSIGVDEAVAIASERYPGAALVGVGLPQGPRGAIRVSLREAGDSSPRPGTAVFVDPRTRAILHRSDRSTRSGGDVFLQWQRIVHEGSALGAIGRALTFLGGLLPPLLMTTGLVMWLRTRRARAAVGASSRSLAGGASSHT